MELVQKRKYAGGYNGDRYSVAGYGTNDGYFIESKNSVTAEVEFITDLELSIHLQKYSVSIFRNNEFLFKYIYTLNRNVKSNDRDFAVVDNIAVNILFQLDDQELDTLLPMIKDSKEHSFLMDYKSKTYYIYCQGDHPAIDEFTINQFNGKFYFDECSLYRENMSVNKILREYSHFSYSVLFHSLSDDDKYLSFSGSYSTWMILFDSKEMVINYFIKKKQPNTLEEVEESNTIPVKSIQDFYDKSFDMVFSHILSNDFIINKMSGLVEDYDLDPKQHWRDFVRLFDMVTI